jgi:hypothetical protein
MADLSKPHEGAVTTAEIQIPFTFTIIHGIDPSRRSNEYKAKTRSLNLMGLVFEAPEMERDGFHLSFTDTTYGRNSLEIVLDLGKRFQSVEVIGQVEWYERRSTTAGHAFIVGVGFIDVPADALQILREYLQQAHVLAR